MDKPFFSVIIPTFNRGYVLERAINSVLNQEYRNFELIIVDDGSTDDTSSLLDKYSESLSLISTENNGVSAARNRGAKDSHGKWLCFLDSDDEWLPNKLQIQFEYLQEHPDISIVHGEELWIRNGVRVNQKKIHQKFGGHIFKKCLPLCLISPSSVAIKRNVYFDAGGFDEDFEVCEDYDLWLKLTSLFEVGFIKEPIMKKYGGHEDQLSRKYFAMDMWRLKSMLRILKIRILAQDDINACKNEIANKANVLIKGYQKHGNEQAEQEVRNLISEL